MPNASVRDTLSTASAGKQNPSTSPRIGSNSAGGGGGGGDDGGSGGPQGRRTSVAGRRRGSSVASEPPVPPPKDTDFVFAVVGAKNCGKSTFVHCALDLKKPATSPAVSKRMSLEGEIFVVTLVEVQLRDLQVGEDEMLEWPAAAGDYKMERIDGVLVLYDVTNPHSIRTLPSILSESPSPQTLL